MSAGRFLPRAALDGPPPSGCRQGLPTGSLREPEKAKERLARRAQAYRAPVDLEDVRDFNFLLSQDEDHGSGEIFVETEWGLRSRILFSAVRNDDGDFTVTAVAVAKRLSSFIHEGQSLKLEAPAAKK
jgi:hypothetical protein